jgi:hypothetical protein
MALILIDPDYINRVNLRPGMATAFTVVAVLNEDMTYSLYQGNVFSSVEQIVKDGKPVPYYGYTRNLFTELNKMGYIHKEHKQQEEEGND